MYLRMFVAYYYIKIFQNTPSYLSNILKSDYLILM
jgi:hypothetical protein